MGNKHQTPVFLAHKPLFGLDIGAGSLKVAQLDMPANTRHGNNPRLIGYGFAPFDPRCIQDGVIVDPERVAEAAKGLFKHHLVGDITTHRVAIALPAYQSFTRSMQLPILKDSELAEAVRLEAEQYLPMPLADVYLDYQVTQRSDSGLEVLAVAVPTAIVDSCLQLSALMGLEPMLVETSVNATGRLFARDKQSDVASVIIDMGTFSSDISIYDGDIVTTGTVGGGGQVFNNVIQKALGVSGSEAAVIKSKYGLGVSRKQKEIEQALEPTLQKIVREIKRLMRYHAERYSADRPIQQVITVGGGANMPGLNEYLINHLRIAVRTCDPWQYVDHSRLKTPPHNDRSTYATAVGLALVEPRKVLS